MRGVYWLIDASVRNRGVVIVATLAFIAWGLVSFRQMAFDAFPDLTNIQVQILTASPGMGTAEVEELVTIPIERALAATPGLVELRSASRTGVSAITAVFEDGADRWLARQLVKERLDLAREDIPPEAGTPELAPPTTGLGEVFQFTVESDRHSLPELYRVFQRDIAPRLRAVPGVVEVNAWGGGSPELHVRLDPFALAARGIAVGEVHARLAGALGRRAGGALLGEDEQELVGVFANPERPEALAALLLRRGPDGAEVRLGDVAEVVEAGALTVGFGSGDGRGEMLFVMVQLLADADALSVVDGVRARLAAIADALPEGVAAVPIYSRDKLVGSTMATVARSLLEGGLLVIVVLLLLLGDLRAGLLAASVIPIAMLGAFVGMNALGYSGNLMSLGAIDFGLVIDGTVVVTESIIALHLARDGTFGERVAERARHVARPVVFAVGILLLVYVPVVLMTGTEGKLFRPMALTVMLAIGTALVLSFTWIPAMASLVVRPRGEHQTLLMRGAQHLYEPVLAFGLRRPWVVSVAGAAALLGGVLMVSRMGVEFVPRLEEGDLVVQTERLPSVSPAEALREVTRMERVIREVPEVLRVASRTGSPALATDPMGLEEADIMVELRPRAAWRPGLGLEELVADIEARIEAEAPGAVLTFSQPIEMRFNELLEGITSDVGVQIFGPDLDELVRLGQQVGAALAAVAGAADVVPPQIEGIPRVDVLLDPDRLARFGLEAREVLDLVGGVQRGAVVGQVTRGQFRDDVVVKLALPPGVPLAELPIMLPTGVAVPLGEVAEVALTDGPAVVSRLEGSRRVIVEANVRGRDVGGFVLEARGRVAEIALPPGYWITWSGQFEQLREATERMTLLIPIVLLLILGVLHRAFASWRLALLVFLNVPVAISGGIALLWLRDLPISMSAIVGFIALFGIAVMNGVVLLARVVELRPEHGARAAARMGALERFRPVLITASVEGIGFMPMALAAGVGAEVQRPLATVIIGGLVTSTALTLVVLPALYARFASPSPARSSRSHSAP